MIHSLVCNESKMDYLSCEPPTHTYHSLWDSNLCFLLSSMLIESSKDNYFWNSSYDNDKEFMVHCSQLVLALYWYNYLSLFARELLFACLEPSHNMGVLPWFNLIDSLWAYKFCLFERILLSPFCTTMKSL